MKPSPKPVRKCNACRLNLRTHCWRYTCPREQWANGRTCTGLDNAKLYEEFDRSMKQPDIRSRKEIRQDIFRARARKQVYKPPRRRKA